MRLSDIKMLAASMSIESTREKSLQRDLYYDPKKDMFLHQKTNSHEHALTVKDGKNKCVYRAKRCTLIGRYDVNVNPSWLVQDMLSV